MPGSAPVAGVRGVVDIVLGRASQRLTVAVLVVATTLAAWASPAQAASTGGNASITLNKTVSGTSINPNLTLTLAVDKSTAIPGDKLTYTATVTNTGASLNLTGQFQAQNDGSVLATISDYYDEVEYFTPSTKVWTPLAGVQVTALGYTPLVQSPVMTGMILTAVPMNASGVSYPSSGDPILGTQLSPTAVAGWNYTAVMPLSLSQIATLSNPAKVSDIRNVVHFEATPRDIAEGQPFKYRATFTDPFLSQPAAVGNIAVTVTLPDGSSASFDSTNTPSFVSLAAGTSASVTAAFTVPVAEAKGISQSDADYFAALMKIDRTMLKATATASGSATGGPVTAPAPPPVSTVEHLPIVSIKKSGPATIAAGGTESNPLALTNGGGAAASGLAVIDSVPSGSNGSVSPLPATLSPKDTTTATATYPVPAGQAAGSLTDTASLTWQDDNHNPYGPVSSSFTTSVTNSLAGATLTLSPPGPTVVVKGTQQSFTATLLDSSGKPVVNQAVLFAVTGANPTSQSANTDTNGMAQFSYSGANGGADQVQASVSAGATTLQSNTVTVNWLVPIVAASTTTVNATFYPLQGCNCFTAAPGLPPIFSTTFPTININPPTGSIPHMPPSIGSFNRPMVSVATDVAGNFSGATIVQGTDAGGVLYQAGSGDMDSFQAVFTGELTIAKSGPLLFSFFSDDGFIFGVSGGATYVSGVLVNPPASGLTAFTGYPVVGSFNTNTAPQERDVTVNFPAPGLYPYEIDYFECCGDGLAFTVGTGGSAGMPPTGNISISPYTLSPEQVGQSVNVNVAAMDASGQPMPNLTIDLAITGANAQHIQQVTDSTGFASFGYQGVNPGQDSLQASAIISGVSEISNVVTITWNPAPPAPTITAPSPQDGTVVTKPVNISATFAPPAGQSIASWQVTYQALDPGPVVLLKAGIGPPPAILAVFDPTLLPNDAYAINISATASGGGVQTITTTLVVLGYLKPGRYITTYQDLNVPVFGFQMQVRRQYDSFDKQQGDFGIGWRVSLNNFRVSTNRQLGAGGWTEYNTQCGLGLCLTAFRSTSPHFVTVVFPDQHTEVFDFSANGGSNIFFSASPVYTPRPGTGTTSTLSAVNDTSLGYNDDGNLYNSSGGIYDPRQFKLTLHDGTVLILDRSSGLVSMTNRNGEFVQVNSAGISARSGQGITFTRDSQSRIIQIVGPSGQTLKYTYLGGDLVSFTDAVGNVTTYTYDSNHDLLTANGPGGQPLQTERYDTSGRLIAITDANNNTVQIKNDVAGRQQTAIDPTGRLTIVYTFDDLGDLVRQDQVSDGKTLTTTATYDSVGRPLTRTDQLNHTWTVTYDSNGNATSITDPLNKSTSVTYDSFGAPVTFQDAIGNVSKYTYDSSENLITFTDALNESQHWDGATFPGHFTDALNRTWSYNPDAAGNVNAIRDPLGGTPRWSYNSLGEMTSALDAMGNLTTYTYDNAGNLLTITDPLNNVTTMTYDPLNRLASRTDATGKTTTYRYDGNGELASETDPLGNVTSYTYDANSRLLTVTDPAGGVTTNSYDGFGRRIAQKDALGRTMVFAYDDAGQLSSRTLPNGGVSTYTYDANGHPTSVTDPLGNKTSYGYDADGDLVSVTDPLNHTTTYTLDALGRQVKITDPLMGTTQMAYDVAGQLISTTDQLNQTTTYGYDAAGNRISVTDPRNHTTTYAYDADRRVVEITDPLNRFVIFNFDSAGNLKSRRLNSGIFLTSNFDADNRVIASFDGLGDKTSYTYDADGRLATVTDPRGHTTTYRYDAAGRQASITDALGGTVTFGYDLAGQETSVTNPRGDITSSTYDSLGNVLTQTDPAGKTTSFTYDLGGRLTSKTDPRGITLSDSYDSANRLTGINFPGGSIALAYDALGRRTSMVDPSGTTNYSYDAASRLTSVGTAQGSVGYTYDAGGNRTSMSLPLRGSITYAYDAANELTSLTDWAGHLFTFTYTADGLPASINRPGNVATSYGYDGADRLVSVHHDLPSGAIAHFDYTLDPNGNPTSMTGAAGTENYNLDALNRLTNASYPNGDVASYVYDAAGNRVSSTFNGVTANNTYDSAGRLVSVGGKAITYDANGNTLSIGSDTYSWDWAGRLASSTVAGLTSNYTYDGDGTRTATTTAGSTTNYVWDQAGSLPRLVDDGTQGYVQTDQGVLEQQGATTTYPLSDALGSVRTIESAAPAVMGTASYDVFGSVRAEVGQQSIFGFTGQQTDSTGLSFLQARYYSPLLGRFLSPDSVQPNGVGSQGYDLYSYVANNPTGATDPSGHQALNDFQRLLLATAVALVVVGTVGYEIRDIIRTIVNGLVYIATETRPRVIRAPVPSTKGSSDGAGPDGPKVDAGKLADALLKAGLVASSSVAAAAAAACAAMAIAGQLSGMGDDPCSGKEVPIFFSMTDTPQTTLHISAAQTELHKPAILNRYMNRPKDPNLKPWEEWYSNLPACNDAAHTEFSQSHPGDRGVCDEYPFHSSRQNLETTDSVSLTMVPKLEGPIQGGDLKTFYDTTCHVPDFGKFAVVPVPALVGKIPDIPSFGWCPLS